MAGESSYQTFLKIVDLAVIYPRCVYTPILIQSYYQVKESIWVLTVQKHIYLVNQMLQNNDRSLSS